MEEPRRIDPDVAEPWSPDDGSQSGISQDHAAYLEGVVDSLTQWLSVSDHEWWVERSLIALDPAVPEVPADEQDVPGDSIRALAGQPTGTLTFLVGESGSGKTAVSRLLAKALAEEALNGKSVPLPVIAKATDVLAASQPSSVTKVRALEQAVATSVGAESVTPEVVAAVLRDPNSRCVVFIDGLDRAYMARTSTNEISGLVTALRSALPRAAFVAPCRQEVWVDADFTPRKLGDAYLLRLLGVRDVADVIQRWWNVKGDHGLAPQAIIDALTSNSYLSDLCRSPSMLGRYLALVERNWSPPESVGGICREISDACLRASDGEQAVRLPSGASLAELEEILSRLAWELLKSSDRGQARVISYQHAKNVAQEVIEGDDQAPTRGLLSDAPREYLELFRSGVGVFGERAPGRLGFSHDAFALYFGGRQLARLLLSGLDADAHLTSPEAAAGLRVWAEASAHVGELDSVIVLIQELAEQADNSAALVAAELLAGISRAAERDRPGWATRWTPRIGTAMIATRSDRGRALRDRMRAGDVLAVLGDPLIPASPEDTEFFQVPAARARVGRELAASTVDRKYQRRHWSTPTIVDLEEFAVSRFPVTNAEFRRFVEAGGYRVERYWRPDGAALWRAQDPTYLGVLREVVAASFDVHYKKDIEGNFMPVLGLHALDHNKMVDEFCDNLLRRNTPMYWLDGRFNNDNQPVVGVNWWEANAYCAWLTERLGDAGILGEGQEVRLLDEQQWEYCASGGNYSNYPWGDEWMIDGAHVRTVRGDWITRAVAIGCFPWAGSPLGPECMVGNVWEWCRSEAPSEPVGPFAAVSGGPPDRTTRGSSWLSKEPLSRNAAFRSWDPPCNAYVDLSFRVSISPVDE